MVWLTLKFRDMGINKKLYCMILSLLIVPLILVFWFMNAIIGREFHEGQCEKRLEILKQSKPVLENVLQDVEMISRNILGDDDTQALLKYYNETEEYDEIAGVNLDFYLRELMASRKYLSSISIYKGERILLQCGNYFEKESIDEMKGLRNRLDEENGRAVWEAARLLPYYRAGNENEYVVSLQRNINNMYRLESLGTERISIKEEYLCSLYRTEDVSTENRMYIYDNGGNIVSSSDKDMLQTKVENGVMENAVGGEGFFQDAAADKVVLYFQIPLNGWMVVKEVQVRDVDAQLLLINIIIWICLALALLFGLCFSFFQKKYVVTPIIELSRAVGRIGGDNLSVGLYMESKDEVGELNRNVIKMTARISELIDKVYKSKIQMREAELLSLQSQINPHFLYNTLDTLRWIAMEHEEREIAEQIEALSSLFRHVLNNGKEITTVKEELEHLKNYLVIQHSRFGDRIGASLQVQEKLYSCRVVKLILQPLVENAFVHGLEKKVGKGEIRVTVEETEGRIRYTVEDNGLGTDEKAINDILEAPENQDSPGVFALANINSRIRLKYGKDYGLRFESAPGKGTKVTVWIPLIREEANEDTYSG